jgi:hypothetical protein
MIKLFVILSVLTLIVVFLYFLYQTNKINKETDDLNNVYMDDSLDTFKLKCPPGYRFNGTANSKDSCILETNPECDNVTGDCNGYCESTVSCNNVKSESECIPPCNWDDINNTCSGTRTGCTNKTFLQYPELDLDNLPELKRNTTFGQAFQKRCKDVSNNSTTYASEYDWEAIAPYCAHIKLQK